MALRPRIHHGIPVENPGPTVFFYAKGNGPFTFPRSSPSLSSFMAAKLSNYESADFLDADPEIVNCIAAYMRHGRYACPAAGLTSTSPVALSVASFKAGLNVAVYAEFLDLPDLLKQANEHIENAEDNLTSSLALQAMIDSGTMDFSDLMPRIDKTTQQIFKYAPPNRYGPLLDAFGVPDTLGKLYVMAVLFTMAKDELKERALERIFEGIGNLMSPAAQRLIVARYFDMEDSTEEYNPQELFGFEDEVHNVDDDDGVVVNRRARRAEQRRTRPRKLKRGKQARASQPRRKRNGRRA